MSVPVTAEQLARIANAKTWLVNAMAGLGVALDAVEQCDSQAERDATLEMVRIAQKDMDRARRALFDAMDTTINELETTHGVDLSASRREFEGARASAQSASDDLLRRIDLAEAAIARSVRPLGVG